MGGGGRSVSGPCPALVTGVSTWTKKPISCIFAKRSEAVLVVEIQEKKSTTILILDNVLLGTQRIRPSPICRRIEICPGSIVSAPGVQFLSFPVLETLPNRYPDSAMLANLEKRITLAWSQALERSPKDSAQQKTARSIFSTYFLIKLQMKTSIFEAWWLQALVSIIFQSKSIDVD